MLQIHRITSRDMPGLEPFLTLRRPDYHRENGLFICQGEKNVSRLLCSGFEIASMIMPEEWVEKLRPLWEMHNQTIPTYVGPKTLLSELIGHKMYQPLMAAGRVPDSPTLESILMTRPHPHLFVAVDRLSNADNLGGLIRNCGAFGVQALIVDSTSCSPFLRRSVRASMGAIFEVPIILCDRVQTALQQLRTNGVQRVATYPDTRKRILTDVDMTRDSCIVLGSEGHGISDEVLAHCDERVAIPMHGAVDSLNVAHASAVFLYEAARQREFQFR